MQPSKSLARMASISSGSFQWPSFDLIPSFGVGLAPLRVWEQMKVLFSTRATSAFFVRQRKLVEGGREGGREGERREREREGGREGGREGERRERERGREGGSRVMDRALVVC